MIYRAHKYLSVSLVISLFVSLLTFTEYPIFSLYFSFPESSRSMFSIYRLPEFISVLLFLATFLLFFVSEVFSLLPRMFPASIRYVALVSIFTLLSFSLVGYLQGFDALQILLTLVTFIVFPAYVLIAPRTFGVSILFFKRSILCFLIASFLLSIVLLFVNALISGTLVLDRTVARFSFVFLFVVLFYIIRFFFSRESCSISVPSFSVFITSLILFLLSGSRSSIVSLFLSLLLICLLSVILRNAVLPFTPAKLLASLICMFISFPFLFYLGFSSLFIRADSSSFFQDSYRADQFSCFLSSFAASPLWGHGIISSPSCWDLYLENVTRVIVELEFLNFASRFGLLYIPIFGLYIIVGAFFYNQFLIKSSTRLLCPVICCLSLPLLSFTSPALFAFSSQFVIIFSIQAASGSAAGDESLNYFSSNT